MSADHERNDPPQLQIQFDHDDRATRAARRALQQMFTEGDAEDALIAEDIGLAASEMVGNVILHTPDGGTLRAWDPKPDVPYRLEVEDSSPELPQSPSEANERGGRGLRIVETVSDDWGVIPSENGKTVWAEFDRDKRRARKAEE